MLELQVSVRQDEHKRLVVPDVARPVHVATFRRFVRPPADPRPEARLLHVRVGSAGKMTGDWKGLVIVAAFVACGVFCLWMTT